MTSLVVCGYDVYNYTPRYKIYCVNEIAEIKPDKDNRYIIGNLMIHSWLYLNSPIREEIQKINTNKEIMKNTNNEITQMNNPKYQLYPIPTYSFTLLGNVYNKSEKQTITGSIPLENFNDIAKYHGLQVAKDGWWEFYEKIMSERKIYMENMNWINSPLRDNPKSPDTLIFSNMTDKEKNDLVDEMHKKSIEAARRLFPLYEDLLCLSDMTEEKRLAQMIEYGIWEGFKYSQHE
jgi:hypothetical protein